MADGVNTTGWEFDFSTWRMGDQDEVATVYQEVRSTGISKALYPFFARTIKRWPYADLDPTAIESYSKLTLKQFKEVDSQFGEGLKSSAA